MGWCVSAESAETARVGTYEVYNSQTGQTTTRTSTGIPNWFPGASKVQNVVIPLGMPVEQIVELIIAAKPEDEKFSKLRLGSHGVPGMLCLAGQGNMPLMESNAIELSPLREHFNLLAEGGDNYGVILIHACKVASDFKTAFGGSICGLALLKKIAEVTNTPVQAPYQDQPMNATKFQGPTLYVYPNGNYAIC